MNTNKTTEHYPLLPSSDPARKRWRTPKPSRSAPPLLFVAAVVAAVLANPANAQTSATPGKVFFSENFDSATSDSLKAKGWDLGKNEFAKEDGTDFVVAPPYAKTTADAPALPGGEFADANGVRLVNPPTADGTQSGGKYLISDSDTAGGSDDIDSKSEFWAITPNFSTMGATEGWFHADVEIENNNNGECVVEFAVTIDDGKTWLPIWQTVEPQRPEKSLAKYQDVATGGNRTGGYPEFGSASMTKSWGGLHGRVHFRLPDSALNQPKVRARVEYYEPADAWWIALDNLVVDGNPPPMGKEAVLSEVFDKGIPSNWKLGTKVGQKWGTEGLKDASGAFLLKQADKAINVDLVKEAASRGIAKPDILDAVKNTEFADINPNGGGLDGKWLTMLAGGTYALWQEGESVDEVGTLDTPVLDMSGATEVFIDFDSELVIRNASGKADVYVSVDNGSNWSRLFTYQGALMNRGEAPYFNHHYIAVPAAAGKKSVMFRFQAEGGDPGRNQGFWAIDNVRVTVNRPGSGEAPRFGAVTLSAGSVSLTWTGSGTCSRNKR